MPYAPQGVKGSDDDDDDDIKMCACMPHNVWVFGIVCVKSDNYTFPFTFVFWRYRFRFWAQEPAILPRF
jgi:hypothetical protein